MSIKDALVKFVGADIKQSVAWIGSVGLCFGVVVAVYLRLGQYIEADKGRDVRQTEEVKELRGMIEPWNEAVDESGTIIYPKDVHAEVLELQVQVNKLNKELEKRTEDRFKRADFERERERFLKANPDLTPPQGETE